MIKPFAVCGLLVLSACSSENPSRFLNPEEELSPLPAPQGRIQMKWSPSCTEQQALLADSLKHALNRTMVQNWSTRNSYSPEILIASATTDSGITSVDTNWVAEGVQELGPKKVHAGFLYTHDLDSKLRVTQLDAPENTSRIPLTHKGRIQGLLLHTETSQLIVIQQNGRDTKILFYSLKNPGVPTIRDTVSLKGNVHRAVLASGEIRVVTQQPYGLSSVLPNAKLGASGVSRSDYRARYFRYLDLIDQKVQQSDIYECETPDTTVGFPILPSMGTTRVASLSLLDRTLRQKSVMGGLSNAYFLKDSLWLTQSSTGYTTQDFTGLWKWNFENGTPTPIAIGAVEGTLESPLGVAESNGVLHIAQNLTRWENNSGDSTTWTRGIQEQWIKTLTTDGDSVVELGRLELPAPEDHLIQASRFYGNRAYIITYAQTDPLFVVDLTHPQNPTLLGQVAFDGFIDYVHLVSPDLLLGVGRQDWNAAKYFLFDISSFPPRIADSITVPDLWGGPSLSSPQSIVVSPELNRAAVSMHAYSEPPTDRQAARTSHSEPAETDDSAGFVPSDLITGVVVEWNSQARSIRATPIPHVLGTLPSACGWIESEPLIRESQVFWIGGGRLGSAIKNTLGEWRRDRTESLDSTSTCGDQ
jgi:hypothetical protein